MQLPLPFVQEDKETPVAKKNSKKENKSSFDLEAYMKRNKSKWSKATDRAKEDSGGIPQFDDGRYRMQLQKMEVGESKKGRPQVISTWKFKEGDYKGQLYKSFQGIDNEDGVFYFLLDVKRLGFEVDEFDPSELGDLIKTITEDKPTALVSLSTKGEYQNLRISRVVESDEDEDDNEDDDDDDEEEKPSKAKKSKKSKK